jgi:hypothetical protein
MECMRHSAATEPYPTRTVHFFLARALARRLGGDTPNSPELLGDSILGALITSEHVTPDTRARYADVVNAAWLLLAFGCGVAMGVLGYAAHVTVGDPVENAVASLAFGGAFFCLGGCANALGRKRAPAKRDATPAATAPRASATGCR